VASILLGTQVPVILADTLDGPRKTTASAALAVLLHAAHGQLRPI
jgi:hypothetical protein